MIDYNILSDMTGSGYDEDCIHFCSICEQFERCKGAECNYSATDGTHTHCKYWHPHWNIAKHIGMFSKQDCGNYKPQPVVRQPRDYVIRKAMQELDSFLEKLCRKMED